MKAAEFLYDYGKNSTSIETTVGGEKALYGAVLTMEEAVQLAEDFMATQQ